MTTTTADLLNEIMTSTNPAILKYRFILSSDLNKVLKANFNMIDDLFNRNRISEYEDTLKNELIENEQRKKNPNRNELLRIEKVFNDINEWDKIILNKFMKGKKRILKDNEITLYKIISDIYRQCKNLLITYDARYIDIFDYHHNDKFNDYLNTFINVKILKFVIMRFFSVDTYGICNKIMKPYLMFIFDLTENQRYDVGVDIGVFFEPSLLGIRISTRAQYDILFDTIDAKNYLCLRVFLNRCLENEN